MRKDITISADLHCDRPGSMLGWVLEDLRQLQVVPARHIRRYVHAEQPVTPTVAAAGATVSGSSASIAKFSLLVQIEVQRTINLTCGQRMTPSRTSLMHL